MKTRNLEKYSEIRIYHVPFQYIFAVFAAFLLNRGNFGFLVILGLDYETNGEGNPRSLRGSTENIVPKYTGPLSTTNFKLYVQYVSPHLVKHPLTAFIRTPTVNKKYLVQQEKNSGS